MQLLRDIRGPEPRLKPGITWTRLVLFVVGAAAFGVVGAHIVTGHEPSSDCGAKGISSRLHEEGSCMEGDTKLVVVNKHSVLKLDSLEAEIGGISERKRMSGPLGTATAAGTYVVIDLAITNLTDAPVTFSGGQALLLLDRSYGEDVAIDAQHEPRSFLARSRKIPPGETEEGTVTFLVPTERIEVLDQHGDLDIGNFDAATASGDFEPEAIFGGSEYGVIRTYK